MGARETLGREEMRDTYDLRFRVELSNAYAIRSAYLVAPLNSIFNL